MHEDLRPPDETASTPAVWPYYVAAAVICAVAALALQGGAFLKAYGAYHLEISDDLAFLQKECKKRRILSDACVNAFDRLLDKLGDTISSRWQAQNQAYRERVAQSVRDMRPVWERLYIASTWIVEVLAMLAAFMSQYSWIVSLSIALALWLKK